MLRAALVERATTRYLPVLSPLRTMMSKGMRDVPKQSENPDRGGGVPGGRVDGRGPGVGGHRHRAGGGVDAGSRGRAVRPLLRDGGRGEQARRQHVLLDPAARVQQHHGRERDEVGRDRTQPATRSTTATGTASPARRAARARPCAGTPCSGISSSPAGHRGCPAATCVPRRSTTSPRSPPTTAARSTPGTWSTKPSPTATAAAAATPTSNAPATTGSKPPSAPPATPTPAPNSATTTTTPTASTPRAPASTTWSPTSGTAAYPSTASGSSHT